MEYQDKEINAVRGDYFVPTLKCNYGPRAFRFRMGSVEGVRRSRYHKGAFYRAMQHMAMRRSYWKALYDEIPLRQSWVEIPDPWTDYPRHNQKSWKKFRATQYKTVDKG